MQVVGDVSVAMESPSTHEDARDEEDEDRRSQPQRRNQYIMINLLLSGGL